MSASRFCLEVMHVLRVQTKNLFTDHLNTKDIPATYEQQGRWLNAQRPGVAMPDLESEHIAFLVSGMTPEERRIRFGDSG